MNGIGESYDRHPKVRKGIGESSDRHLNIRKGIGKVSDRHLNVRKDIGKVSDRHLNIRKYTGKVSDRYLNVRMGTGKSSDRHLNVRNDIGKVYQATSFLIFTYIYSVKPLQPPHILITQEMLDEAVRLIPQTKVERTVASKIDTLTGHLGEFAFAEYMFGDWRKNYVGKNKGENDFGDFEIKTSAFPFNSKLNLLVREDYARKRKPKFYVQLIIDVPSHLADSIAAGTRAYLCGYATAEELDKAPLKDFGSKTGTAGGYRCHFIPITKLKPVEELRNMKLKFANLSVGNILSPILF